MKQFQSGNERHEHVLQLETAVWNALVKGDAEADRRALHPAFFGVYKDGFSDRAGHVGQLDKGPTVARFRLSDVHVGFLGNEHAVISYRANFQRINQIDAEEMFVTSIWQRDEKGWVNILSQDTPSATNP